MMGWWMKFGFGNERSETDELVRRRVESQERAARELAQQVRRIDQAIEVIRRRLDDEGRHGVG